MPTFRRRKRYFCEQKVAKNFINLGRGGFTGIGPSSKKFLRRFFKKWPLPLWAKKCPGLLRRKPLNSRP
jgi:hypothetical protein